MATGGSGSSAFIVEDEATPSHTQMRKSDFLEAARASICAAANEELVAAGRTADGCPYVERWVAYYGLQSAERMNRALRLYAPESATAHSASQAVPLLVARIRAGVRTWVTTGRVEGVPTESAANAAPPVRTSSGGRPAADGAAVI